jgi:uncharacterized repeat protein (TIGR01451 family)
LTDIVPYDVPLGPPGGGITGVNSGSLLLVFGTSGVTGTVTTTAASANVSIPGDLPHGWPEMVGAFNWDYLTEAPGPVAGYTRPGPQVFLTTRANSAQTMQVTFSAPLIAPYFHVNGLDGSWVQIGAPLTVTTVSKNDEMTVVGNTLNTVYGTPVGDGCRPNNPAPGDAWRTARCGTFLLGDGPATVVEFVNQAHGNRGDGWNSSWSFPWFTVDKVFGAASILAGTNTSLTLTLQNPTPGALSGLDFIDALPAGLNLANGTVTAVGCGAPVFGAPANLNATGIVLAPSGTCTMTFTVTGNMAGAYTFDDSQFTGNAANLRPGANAVLDIDAAPLTITPISTLSGWGLMTVGGLLALFGFGTLRRRA